MVRNENISINKPSPYEHLKVMSLSISFFFIVGTYSILRPLKISVFLGLVGREYQPITKFITIITLIPCLLFYSKLVDKLKRHQLVHTFLLLYAGLALLFAYLLTIPSIGLQNTATNPNRILGWAFYLFTDLYSPLILSVFWAFINSINTPDQAKKNYGKIVAISRIAGILTPIFSWMLINKTGFSSIQIIPMLITLTCLFLILSSVFVARITKKIPNQYLKGYEAQVSNQDKNTLKPNKSGIIEGLKLMLQQPYVFGIFALVYSFEVVSIIIDYQMQVLMSIENNNTIAGMSSYMFLYTASFQTLGFIFAILGTSKFLKFMGVKKCLTIMPMATAILMIGLLFYPSLTNLFIIMVVLRALHYGFNTPVREILYIPTTKNIKFKSKAWIDSFGRTLSKTSGSTFNLIAQNAAPSTFLKIDSLFSIAISMVWGVISIAVGKKYISTIAKGEIIGDSPKFKGSQLYSEKTVSDSKQNSASTRSQL